LVKDKGTLEIVMRNTPVTFRRPLPKKRRVSGRLLGFGAAALVTLGGLLAHAAGRPSDGIVTGEVRFDGQPLGSGTVTFVTAAGERSTSLAPDGTYQLAVPPGPATILFFNHPAVPPGLQDEPWNEPPLPPVPQRYESPQTSGLTCTVHRGSQVCPIDLTP
jgi:hypothetical protein